MKRSVGLLSLVGFSITCLLGTILHFLYDLLGQAKWITPFSGVNESTWEHMKLIFWPMLIFAIAERFFLQDRTDFWCVKLKGILMGLGLIPVLFYTYNGAIGPSSDYINIAIFFLSAGIAFLWEYNHFQKKDGDCRFPRLSILFLCLIGLLFALFTFFPPKIGLFLDPITRSYGI